MSKLNEKSTTADVFAAIAEQDKKNESDANKYRLIGKAAEALAAAANVNGIPVDVIIPVVQYLAGRIVNPKYKKDNG